VSIHAEVSYEMLNSRIISGIAGNSMVSPYIVISIVEPKMTNVFHAEVDILPFTLSLGKSDKDPGSEDDNLSCLLSVFASLSSTREDLQLLQ
jgi:hypothetical protein